jgi:hypothetical protein
MQVQTVIGGISTTPSGTDERGFHYFTNTTLLEGGLAC